MPLAGLIDVEAERARLSKEIERQSGEQARIEKKLGNESFVAKAPAAVVEKERDKLNDVAASLATLNAQLESLDAL